MAKAYWKAEHVRTLAELPDKLVKGRAYFVDDENYIVIDHGDNRGIQIYGNRPGIQGPPGEPIPQLSADIETHSKSIMNLTQTLLNLHLTYTERFNEIERVIGAILGVGLYAQNVDIDAIKQAAGSEQESDG